MFLDIDGVLVPFGDGAARPPKDGSFPCKPLAALSRIVEATGAEIVLSSTWRCHPKAIEEITTNFCFYALRQGGPLGQVTSLATTSLANHSYRQWEIAEWLASPAAKGVERWVALDDEPLLEGAANAERRAQFDGHVVQTSSHVGLTREHAEKAIALLQAQDRAAAKHQGEATRAASASQGKSYVRRVRQKSAHRVNGWPFYKRFSRTGAALMRVCLKRRGGAAGQQNRPRTKTSCEHALRHQ